MSPSLIQILLVLLLVFILFGAGKLPRVMSDLGKGIRGLKKGLHEDDEKDATKDDAMKVVSKKKQSKK